MQARAPYSVAELQKRLVPSGAYLLQPYGIDDDIVVPDILESRLHLNSFQHCQHQPFLELQPLPMPYKGFQDMPEPIHPVSVISCDGRAKPLMFGLSIKQVRVTFPTHACQTP